MNRMMMRMALLILLVAAAATATTVDAASSISIHSSAGRRLLASAWQEEDTDGIRRSLADNNAADYSFLADYSIKFQGCHHVQQWNDNAGDDGDNDENDVKIMTKRLARFRLCPADQCSHDKSAGCTSKFGDYVVDMDTFVEAYLQAIQEDQEEICGSLLNDCVSNSCAGAEDDYACLETCFASYHLETCYYDYYGYVSYNNNNDDANGDDDGVQEGGGMEDFDVAEYAACANFDLPDNNNGGRRSRQLEEDAVEYFIGAFCADQGGEIHLGLFTDDTCTTFASNGYNLFQSAMGFALPFSESSLVTNRCLNCGENYGDGQYGDAKEVCTTPYELAGKCETRMAVDYPNEASCNYIEGIKIIREDGVIRTSATKKSKAAAVAIGLFTTLSVLLAAYVFYLRTKLSRAQINLAASAQPLT